MSAAYSPVEQLNELIRGIEFAMLTTIRTDGSLHSCPMATQEADADGVLWFFTGSKTEKVEALRTNNQLCVSYADPDNQRYVSVTGIGELVRSELKVRELWNPLYEPWFPRGLDDPDLILIKVLILDAEYWHAPEGRMAQVLGFTKAAVTGQQYQPAEHREVQFPKNQRDRNQ